LFLEVLIKFDGAQGIFKRARPYVPGLLVFWFF